MLPWPVGLSLDYRGECGEHDCCCRDVKESCQHKVALVFTQHRLNLRLARDFCREGYVTAERNALPGRLGVAYVATVFHATAQ